jgi:hypothetical protein
MRTTLLFFFLAGVLRTQAFTFGVKAGVSLTTDLDNYDATSESKRYVLGPMITAGLPLGFRLEVDGLYRRVGLRTSFGTVFGYFTERDRGNSWEFPIILRHSLVRGLYAGAGYAPRTINGTAHINQVSLLPVSFNVLNLPGGWDVTHGVTGTAGIEKRAGPLRIAPEVRYTFWTSPALEIYGAHGYFVQSSQHQIDLLLGISFP